MLCFVLYPMVSLSSVEALNCDGDVDKLYADYREACWQPHLMLYSYLAIVVFPVGVPLGMIIALFVLGVPGIAKDKIDAQSLHSMIALYRNRTAVS